MVDQDKRDRLHHLLRVGFRRRWLFVLSAALAAIAILVAWHYVPLKYTGTAIFERRWESTDKEQSQSFEAVRATLRQDLSGDKALEQAIEELGLTKGLSHAPAGETAKQDIVQRFREGIKVRFDVAIPQVDYVAVEFTSPDPILAEGVPTKLVAIYVNSTSEKILKNLGEKLDFLKESVGGCKDRLYECEDARGKFEKEHPGMLPDNLSVVSDEIQRIDTDIGVLGRQQTEARQEAAMLKVAYDGPSQAASVPGPTTMPTSQATQPVQVAATAPNPEHTLAEEELKKARAALEELQKTTGATDKHPTVQQLKRKIELLEERLAKIPAGIPVTGDSVYPSASRPWDPGMAALRQQEAQRREDLAMRLAAARLREQMAKDELDRLEKRRESRQAILDKFASNRLEYVKITTDLANKQDELRRWEHEVTEVQMALDAEVAKKRTRLETVQAAKRPSRPSSPSLWMVLGGAVFGGLGCGVLLVFGVNALDRTIATTDDADGHFDLPIHGTISEIVTRRQRRRRLLRRWTVGPAIGLIVLATLSASVLSAVLRLRYPEKYEQWRASPTAFVTGELGELASRTRAWWNG